MSDTDKAFNAIANAEVSQEANNLLDKQLGKVLQWREKRHALGESADLMDLIRQVRSEPNKRGPVLSAYAAAMWRLLEKEHKL